MAFDKETAARLESLYREHLKQAFQETFTFDPITVELTQNMFDETPSTYSWSTTATAACWTPPSSTASAPS